MDCDDDYTNSKDNTQHNEVWRIKSAAFVRYILRGLLQIRLKFRRFPSWGRWLHSDISNRVHNFCGQVEIPHVHAVLIVPVLLLPQAKSSLRALHLNLDRSDDYSRFLNKLSWHTFDHPRRSFSHYVNVLHCIFHYFYDLLHRCWFYDLSNSRRFLCLFYSMVDRF